MSDATSTVFWAVWYFQGGPTSEGLTAFLSEPDTVAAIPENFRDTFRGLLAGHSPERWEAAVRFLVAAVLGPLSDTDLVAGATDVADALAENEREGYGASEADERAGDIEANHRNNVEELLVTVGGFLEREING